MRLYVVYLPIQVLLSLAGVNAFVVPKAGERLIERATAPGQSQLLDISVKSNYNNLQATETSQDDATDSTSSTADQQDDWPEVLLDAIAYNTTEAANSLLYELSRMREKKVPQEETTIFLNELLSSGPDKSLPFWSRSKRLARYSKRARLASLKRTLSIMTPPPSESESLKENEQSLDTPEQQLQRRRRALVTLLRSLSTLEEKDNNRKVPTIVALEKKALSASKENKGEDLRSRLPEGLETPAYEIIAKSNNSKGASDVEIREYKPYTVCAVSMVKPRPEEAIQKKTDAKLQMPEMGGASSFGALAGYLFGKNDQSTAMKMTTPVFTTTPDAASAPSDMNDTTEDRQMEFVLPSDYWDTEGLTMAPRPLEGSGVTLQQKDKDQRAVVMFGGYASRKEVDKRQAQLLDKLAKQFPDWQVAGTQQDWKPSFTLAQYNDPFTPPWRRLNEVSVEVKPKE